MNDNLKLVNQTLLVLDDDLDETVFEKLYERPIKKSTLVQNVPLPCQSDMVHKTEPFFCHQRLRAMVPDIWENQQQNVLISQMERSRDRAAAAVSVKKGEGQDCRSRTSEGPCVRDKGSFEHNPTKKRERQGAKIKESRSKEQVSRTSEHQEGRKKPIWQRRSSSKPQFERQQQRQSFQI